ncbi:uncharacterized protein A1O5_11043 [Cladophialophora psammophila CBS 110553]|uniref:Uncharacterized protein n=1 Tax=Cladophialophora psammophila CBS 110553 TaxID=1182543 RepID=W9WCH5_9EURO|nr:uncharacterized protein A1O5_11043 [Cladophialophora psammophila CBS 110553]EXJ65802.1 hypothetical protein A1O5_11043 [Cladophialophora psammophila CBS 110553]
MNIDILTEALELLYEDSEVAKRRMESAGISTDQSSSPERDATLYEKNSSTRSDDGHGRIPSYSRLPNSSYRAALCRFPSDNLASSPPTTSASYGTPSFTSYNANPITRANPIFPGPAEPPRNVAITSVPTKYPLRERADSAISVPDADVDPGGAGSRLQVTSGSTSTRRQDRTYRDSRRSMSPEDKALQGQPQRPAAKSERYGGHPPRRPEPREDRGQKRPK